MTPSKEIMKMYRNVIADILYREPDKWKIVGFDTYDSYLYYENQKFKVYYYVYKFGKNIQIQLHSGETFLIRDKGVVMELGFKMMEEAKKNNQNRLDNKFFEAIPFTSKRRLKIEKIYSNIK